MNTTKTQFFNPLTVLGTAVNQSIALSQSLLNFCPDVFSFFTELFILAQTILPECQIFISLYVVSKLWFFGGDLKWLLDYRVSCVKSLCVKDLDC